MRTVGTDKVRLRQVNTSHTNVAVTRLCMAVNRIHEPQTCPNMKLKAVNDHGLMMTIMTQMTWVTVSEGLERGIRLNSSLGCQLLQNF